MTAARLRRLLDLLVQSSVIVTLALIFPFALLAERVDELRKRHFSKKRKEARK